MFVCPASHAAQVFGAAGKIQLSAPKADVGIAAPGVATVANTTHGISPVWPMRNRRRLEMRRALILYCGWMAVWVPVALGQVAAPSLIPATADIQAASPGSGIDPYFTPVNPAVMSWNKTSVIGAGVIALEDTPAAGPPTDKYSGYFGGLRWGGAGKLALGLEAVSIQSDTAGIDFKHSRLGAALSAALGSNVAVGVGADAMESSKGAAPNTGTEKLQQLTAGVSLKFGSLFHAGFGVGRDNNKQSSPGASISGERSVALYGLALFNAEGTPWHLEYSVVDKGDYTSSGVNLQGGYNNATLRAEVIVSKILLAYASYSNKSKTGGAQLDGTAIDAGWAPDKGLSLTARLENTEQSNSGVKGNKQQATLINVAYQF
jgi:hypothetical protein